MRDWRRKSQRREKRQEGEQQKITILVFNIHSLFFRRRWGMRLFFSLWKKHLMRQLFISLETFFSSAGGILFFYDLFE